MEIFKKSLDKWESVPHNQTDRISLSFFAVPNRSITHEKTHCACGHSAGVTRLFPFSQAQI